MLLTFNKCTPQFMIFWNFAMIHLFSCSDSYRISCDLIFGLDDGHFDTDHTSMIIFIQIQRSNWLWSFVQTRALSFENFIEQQHKTRLQTFHVSIIGYLINIITKLYWFNDQLLIFFQRRQGTFVVDKCEKDLIKKNRKQWIKVILCLLKNFISWAYPGLGNGRPRVSKSGVFRPR